MTSFAWFLPLFRFSSKAFTLSTLLVQKVFHSPDFNYLYKHNSVYLSPSMSWTQLIVTFNSSPFPSNFPTSAPQGGGCHYLLTEEQRVNRCDRELAGKNKRVRRLGEKQQEGDTDNTRRIQQGCGRDAVRGPQTGGKLPEGHQQGVQQKKWEMR